LPEILFGLIASGAVIGFVITQRRKLVVMLVSPDVASTAGIAVRRLNLLYLEAFALTTARFLGVLLMGALIIIPAVTAKRLARSLRGMLLSAVAVAVTATAAGTWLASQLHRETGPLIVIVAAACFVLSFLRR
jgi:ABC-type Mn2+/Zn2+ transport system permease subunit